MTRTAENDPFFKLGVMQGAGMFCDSLRGLVDAQVLLSAWETFKAKNQPRIEQLLTHRCAKHEWLKCSEVPPPLGIVVDTKVDDERGCGSYSRNVYEEGHWWAANKSAKIWYKPTHWKPTSAVHPKEQIHED